MGKTEELLLQGWRRQQAGDPHQAELFYREAVKTDSNHADARLQLGIHCLRLDRLDEAVEHLRLATQLQPDRAEAHTNLGVAHGRLAHRVEAIASFERALQLDPDNVNARFNLGFALREDGRLDEAMARFQEVIAAQPSFAPAHLNMGWTLFNQRKLAEAEPYLRRAVQLAPANPEAHCNLGRLLVEQEKLAEAIPYFEQACRLKPDYAEAHANLGVALFRQDKTSEALAALRQAVRLKPESTEVHNAAGVVLAEMGDYEAAVASFEEALRFSPQELDALVNLGDALRRCGRLDEAVAKLRQALALRPSHAEAHHNLAFILADQGHFTEAFQEYDACLQLQADNPNFRKNRAITLLRCGKWEEGWREFEWRWQCKEFKQWADLQKQTFPQPTWDGSSLEGKTIFLYPEQGYGDTLQFIRYAPMLRQRGATVLVSCPAALQKIVRSCPGIDRLVSPGPTRPAFDVQASLMSLPHIFGTTIDNVPANVSYLFADPQLTAYWQRKLSPLRGFRIGICWQGNTKHRGDRLRSFPLSQFASIAKLPGVRLISLQKGTGAAQLDQQGRDEMAITNLDDQLEDFMDTAAVMKNLDLVITCDTSVGHLAGAIGVPVWLALSFAADWRWLLDRQDTPWYPTMKLFRQKELGKWEDVFADMTAELSLVVGNAASVACGNTGDAGSVACDDAFSWHRQGVRCLRQGRADEAIRYLRRVIEVQPDLPEAHSDLGAAYTLAMQKLGDDAGAADRAPLLAEAAASFQRALQIQPACTEAHYNLGYVLRNQGKLEEAAGSYIEALRLQPDHADAHFNLGNVLREQGKLVEAAASYQQAARHRPDFVDAHWNRALLCFLLGDWPQAWEEYEWRWQKSFMKLDIRPFAQPVWQGDPLPGGTIFLQTEQGLGDTLQFVRYAALVKERVGTVVCECPPGLARLLGTCRGIDHLVPRGGEPAFDVRSSLLSLPRIFGTALTDVDSAKVGIRNAGAGVPYLFADPQLTAMWRRELSSLPGFRIGIVWQGNPVQVRDKFRSFPLSQFAPLARLPGVRLISLQKGAGLDQLAALQRQMAITHLGDRLNDFMETAAVMKNLDLVITCDSAVGHLAGALGVPVWLALPHAGDFRWLLDRQDTAWYPTMRLFRQKEAGKWEDVFANMAQEVSLVLGHSSLVLGPSSLVPGHANMTRNNETRTNDQGQVTELFRQGLDCLRQSKLDEAIQHFRHVIDLQPDHAEAHGKLGTALALANRKQRATQHAGANGGGQRTDVSAAELARVQPQELNSCEFSYGKEPLLEQAVASFRRAVQLQPASADAHSSLAYALQDQGNLEEAAACYREALRLEPGLAAVHINLGTVLLDLGKLDEAAASFEKALKIRPDLAVAHYNLGNVLRQQEKLEEAAASYERAIKLRPEFADAHNNLAHALRNQGRGAEAAAEFRAALELRPGSAEVHANLVFHQQFQPDYDAQALHEELSRWNQRHAEPLKRFILPHANLPDPERRLRVGFVSPDFRNHCQSFFTVPLLANLDRRQVEVICYADVARPDSITERLRSHADVWRSTVGLSDEQVANLVRSDRIDVLVDLTMHMTNGRPLVFARKPAPVQVAWLAYPGSTGMTAMDYRLTDPYLDPPGLNDAYYSEKSVRLPDTFWCYDPLTDEPSVNALPALCANSNFEFRISKFTWGCLNNFCKINDGTLALWAKVFQAVPDSHLLLRAPRGGPRDRVLATLQQAGMAPERVEFVDTLPRPEYLRLFHRIDACLDPLPANGHTTSLDAFWMGVPTVTLIGKTVLGRAGWCQLCNLGLKELAAETPEQFVSIAAGLAGDLARLQELRGTLRQRLVDSPLMDAKRFARHMEQAFRQMWYKWCQKRIADLRLQIADSNLQSAISNLQSNDAGSVAYGQSSNGENVDQLFQEGEQCLRQGQPEEAIRRLRRVIELKPDLAEAHGTLGLAQLRVRREQSDETPLLEEAAASLRQAVRLQPTYAEAHYNLGYALQHLGRLEEATAGYREALRLRPDHAEVHLNLGNVLRDLGQLPEAAASYQHAANHPPTAVDARWNQAMLRLLQGDFEQGWTEYEWRWQTPFSKADMRPFSQPVWQGAPIRTILLHTEQGLGDTIQFIRYAALVKERVGTVLLECQPALPRLLAGCPGIDGLFPVGSKLPPFDVHVPLLSLPRIFGTTLSSVPARIPYLFADPQLTATWQRELSPLQGFRIGICWQGRPTHAKNRWRSFPVSQFAPIAQLPGVRLVSLQKGAALERGTGISACPGTGRDAGSTNLGQIINLDDRLRDFMDTAAVMKNLDLVITCDTSVAHLAGALGVPVWVALPFAPDWRWLLNREDTPWYPTMKLFRQKEFDRWDDVFASMAQEVSLVIGHSSLVIGPSSLVPGHANMTRNNEPRTNDQGQVTELFRQGVKCLKQGRHDEAIQYLRRVIELQPDLAEAHSNLGVALANRKQRIEAIASFQRALQLKPDNVDARFNLGFALREENRLEEALACFREVAVRQPSHASAQTNLGWILYNQGKFAEAEPYLRAAVQLGPAEVQTHFNLGQMLLKQSKLGEALSCFEEACRLQPDFVEAQTNRGTVHFLLGRIEEAIAAFRTVVECKPDSVNVHSNIVYTMQYHADYDAAAIRAELRRWNEQHAEPLRQSIRPHINHADPDRRLRVGFVSPVFRDHCQSFFTIPLFTHLDRRQVEVYCYADVASPDFVTARVRGHADVWRSTVGLSDEQIAEQVRSDQIDILVDLNMHMANSRPLVFARKPAPVQAAWLAYPGSTGMRAIDYRLTDPYLDPPGPHEAWYSEETVRLPDTFWCYDPLTDEPFVNDLPALCANSNFEFRISKFTWGCLNNFCKINDGTLALWAKVFRAVPNSRLLLMAPGPRHEDVLATLQKEGMSAERVEFVERLPRPDYLRLFHRIDACLDPLPYNGHTTSLDAFWMGVPTITLIGKTVVGRAGWSQLCNLDLRELAAETPEQFVSIAAGLAGDLARLQELRGTLRRRMAASPLMDAKRFARHMEQVLRQMWRKWCQKRIADLRLQIADSNLQSAISNLQSNDAGSVAYDPRQLVDGLFREAVQCLKQGRADEAIPHLQRVIELQPDLAEAHTNLGVALASRKQRVEAMASFERALRLNPANVDARFNLGLALREEGRFEEAVARFHEVLGQQPNYAPAHLNMGCVLFEQRKVQEAGPYLQRAAQLAPGNFETHCSLALCRLIQGDFRQGWEAYEWRWHRDHMKRDLRPFPQPFWQGQHLPGGTILLHTEQGLGDTIQFIRYAALVKERVGTVLCECQPELVKLLGSCAGIDQVLPRGGKLPTFDVRIPLLSLPHVFGTTLSSVPAKIPYLFADPQRTAFWERELSPLRRKLEMRNAKLEILVGISWQGNAIHPGDKLRSFPVSQFLPLARVPGVRLVSLQKGAAREQLASVAEFARIQPQELNSCEFSHGKEKTTITDLGDRLDDFMDTAAVMKNLDLVITCDTAVAHLAGALGVPVWLALPFAADWRWLMDRQDTPWYPTMRLFRQKQVGQWEEVFANMAEELPLELVHSSVVHPGGQVQTTENCDAERRTTLWHDAPRRDNGPGTNDQGQMTKDDLQRQGILLLSQGKLNEAASLFRRAVELAPADAEARCNLGRVLVRQGNLAEACSCFEQACRLRPDYAEAHANLGMALFKQKRCSEALASLHRAIRLQPERAEMHFAAGVVLIELGDCEGAAECFQEGLRFNPNDVSALVNLGDCLRRCGRVDEAAAKLRQAIQLVSRFDIQNSNLAGEAHNNLAITLADQRKFAEAFQEYDAALRLQPDNPLWRVNRAISLLRCGDWQKGWADFESRWQCREKFNLQTFPEPRWDGGPLAGKTILLYPEQGIGDTLQFIRYGPLVRERGANVLLRCPASLERLLSRCPGIDGVLGEGSSRPAFDVHAPLMSLPGIFGTTIANVPANIPYLFADPERAEFWRRELSPLQGFRIGICWQGSPAHPGDRLRSFPLSHFAAMAQLPEVRLVSLQKGPGKQCGKGVSACPGTGRDAGSTNLGQITDLGERLEDFADTAAVMKNLDLVITCDSAVGHLAGGLGVPVWIALPYAADWRWLLDRQDTPWYPTMRLFRQKQVGNWDEVFANMARELSLVVGRSSMVPGHVRMEGNGPRTNDQGQMTKQDLFRQGVQCIRQGKMEEAIQHLQRLIELQPDLAEAHSNLGVALASRNQRAEAIPCFERALQLNPANVDACYNLACALRDEARFDEALARYRQAAKLQPTHAPTQLNLGWLQGNPAQAEPYVRQAVQLAPNDPEAHCNLAFLLLLQGDWPQGWAEYEWRWQRLSSKADQRPCPQPLWEGEAIPGKTILLHAEQGLGDTLQFIRYAALVKERAGTVVCECPPALAKLLASCPGIDQIVPHGQKLPAFDAHAPLMSLPRIFGTTLANVPARIPYLFADPRRMEFWQRELSPPRRKFEIRNSKFEILVGICWQGNSIHPGDKLRSFPVSQLAPLAQLPGVRLVSLQKGPGKERGTGVSACPGTSRDAGSTNLGQIINLGDRLNDFTDTAAVMKNLDLVITCDTAVAHLAGALGVPVWLALCVAADWRWLLDRQDTPWYPTMRLFRQKKAGQWGEVFANMAHELSSIRSRSSVVVGDAASVADIPKGDAGSVAYDQGPAAACHSAIKLGLAQARRNERVDAIASFERALQWNPASVDALYNLGFVLREEGRFDEALACFQRVVAAQPAHADAHINLGWLLIQKGKVEEAGPHIRQAVQLDPTHAESQGNLGNLLLQEGKVTQAIACFEEACRLRPESPTIHTNFVYSLLLHPDYDAAAIFAELRRWNERHAEPLRKFIRPHANDPDPQRRLRVGFVSPDFRDHCQLFYTIPLFANLDRRQVEVHCFADVARADSYTERVRRHADRWHDTAGLSDEQIAELVRSERIDILVDLTMHMANGRPLVFARKPAPVQVCWLAYPGSTGMTAIDYRLTDPYLDPPEPPHPTLSPQGGEGRVRGEGDALYAEESVRLPDTFWCYDPPERGTVDEPPVNALPALCSNSNFEFRISKFTWGCLNHFCKINDGALALWAKVLQAVPNSGLLLSAPPPMRGHALAILRQEGVPAERVEFVDRMPRLQYLHLFHRIDACLDLLPYNGHTTSLDAFWMGVPTITLIGKTVVGRAGWSQLCNMGLKELAAQTPEQFVDIAVKLAGDLAGLQELRGTLRQRFLASPLADAKRFAYNMEQAFRQMWHKWCQLHSEPPA